MSRSQSPAKLLYSPWCKKASVELKVYNHGSLDQDKNKVKADPNNSAFKPVTRAAVKNETKKDKVLPIEILEQEHLGGVEIGSGKIHSKSSQPKNSQKTISDSLKNSASKKMSAGLKDLSLKVMEQVIKDKTTTYADVAHKIVATLNQNG